MNYRNVREQITDQLREEILLGKYKPGEPLREIPLAKRFRVSRGPIRDAFLKLTQEGLLESETNRGVRVGKIWDEKVIPIMTKIRYELESFAIAELIRNLPEGFPVKIRKNLRLFKLACEDQDLPAAVQLDLQFHRLLLRESGHIGLESVWLPLLGGLRLPFSRHKILSESYLEHEAIFEAIQQGNIKTALLALEKNIMQSFTKK